MIKNNDKKQEYLLKIFQMLKKREGIVIGDKKTHFNNTELRMIHELIVAKYEGRRLISSQLARILGVTRSAVSQIVNRMEADGVIVRIPDEKDKKIAYVELAESTLKTYEEDIATYTRFVDGLIEEFGKEKFDTMYELFNEFVDLAAKKMKGAQAK